MELYIYNVKRWLLIEPLKTRLHNCNSPVNLLHTLSKCYKMLFNITTIWLIHKLNDVVSNCCYWNGVLTVQCSIGYATASQIHCGNWLNLYDMMEWWVVTAGNTRRTKWQWGGGKSAKGALTQKIAVILLTVLFFSSIFFSYRSRVFVMVLAVYWFWNAPPNCWRRRFSVWRPLAKYIQRCKSIRRFRFNQIVFAGLRSLLFGVRCLSVCESINCIVLCSVVELLSTLHAHFMLPVEFHEFSVTFFFLSLLFTRTLAQRNH